MIINESVLNEFSFYLKKDKYKNKIQDLKLEYCTDDKGDYIYLVCIKIKKSQKQKGYGTAVMSDIVELADKHNVRIKLWVTNIFGSDLNRLYRFYERHGFVLIKKDNDGCMEYFPKNCNNSNLFSYNKIENVL